MQTAIVDQANLTPDPSLEMVSWFIKEANAPLKVVERSIGSHRYFLCISGLWERENFIPVCGRGQTKLQAAIRCIGEYLERKAVFDFFRNSPSDVRARSLHMTPSGSYRISNETSTHPLLLKEFWTTNGWAVHTSLESAIGAALDEALERHLLMSSFLRWGWKGFIEVGQVEIDDLRFRSCISRYKTNTHSAGFAIAGKTGAQGVSFGHFCEQTASIGQSRKWTQALYESADKLTTDFDASQARDPIAEDVDWYLKNDVPSETADDKTEQEEIYFSQASVVTQNLSEILKLPFPLYSAFVFGGDLMPLFLPRKLSRQSRQYVESKGKYLGFEIAWTERIPVL